MSRYDRLLRACLPLLAGLTAAIALGMLTHETRIEAARWSPNVLGATIELNFDTSTPGGTITPVIGTRPGDQPACPTQIWFPKTALSASGSLDGFDTAAFRAEVFIASQPVTNTSGLPIGVGSFAAYKAQRGWAGVAEFIPSATGCTPRRFVWGDVDSLDSGCLTDPNCAAKFRTTVFTAGGEVVDAATGRAGGQVRAATLDDASGLKQLSFDYTQGACRYAGALPGEFPYRMATEYQAVDFDLVFTYGPESVAGAIVAHGNGSCPPVVLRFSAQPGFVPAAASTPAPTPTAVAAPIATAAAIPTPAPAASAARVVSGAIPASGGVGLIVFGGGSSEQLVTASGCPRASAAFWASTADGGFDSYVPGAAVAVVNAAWNARFAGGIPANTPLIGRCQ